jgi:hypothetical protein
MRGTLKNKELWGELIQWRGRADTLCAIHGFCGIGFKLWALGLPWTKFRRLKPAPLKGCAIL